MRTKHVLPLLVCFLFLFGIQTSAAQQSLEQRYHSEVIYLQMGKFYKNGKKLPLGFFHSKLENEMQTSPETKWQYQLYKKKRNTSLAFSFVSLGAVVAAAFTPNDKLRDGLLYGGLVSSMLSLPFTFSAANQLQRAVWLRNKDVLIH